MSGDDNHATQHLVMVAGYAGSGKTTLSRHIAHRTGWSLLDKDVLTGLFADALTECLTGEPDDRHSATYEERVRPLEYAALMSVMRNLLENGAPGVVMVAPFVSEVLDPHWANDLELELKIKGVGFTLVWVHCEKDTLKGRIVGRGEARDRWKFENWEEWAGGLRAPVLRAGAVLADNTPDVAVPDLAERVLGQIDHPAVRGGRDPHERFPDLAEEPLTPLRA